MCDELTATPIPCTAHGDKVEKIRSKIKPWKKGGVRGRCF